MTGPFETMVARIRASWKGGRHVLVIAPPKSGSTFIGNVLAHASGLPVTDSMSYWSGPNEFSVGRAIELSDRDLVIKTHARLTRPVIALINATRARPVVLRRDIADSIVSMTEHRLRANEAASDQALRHLPREDQLRLTAYDWLHWYADFEAGWDRVARRHGHVLRLGFDAIVADPAAAARRAFAHVGLDVPDDRIARAVTAIAGDAALSNRNVGAAGRGRDLPEDVRHAIAVYHRMASLSSDMGDGDDLVAEPPVDVPSRPGGSTPDGVG